MDTPMYANCKVNDEKHKKFLKMFDFKPQILVQEPNSSDVYILYKHTSSSTLTWNGIIQPPLIDNRQRCFGYKGAKDERKRKGAT